MAAKMKGFFLTVLFFSYFAISTPTPPSPWPELESLYSIENVMKHLNELEKIAYGVGFGNRAAGTSGYNASVDYVVEYLKTNTNFSVSTQTFPFYHYTELSTPILTMESPSTINYEYDVDFTALRNSNSGEVTAPIQYVGDGCDETAFEGFVAGNIAVCDYNGCPIEVKINVSISFDAAAVFIINNPGDGVNSGTIDDPVDRIVFGLRNEIGKAMIEATGAVVYAKADIKLTVDYTANIIADAPDPSDPSSDILIFGSHLDSVVYGPGINDDGSGSSALLELARSFSLFLTSHSVENRVRICWFGAEELGKIGSRYYVNSLKSSGALSQVSAYYNLDMVGSPNFYRGVYNGSTVPEGLEVGSIKLQNILLDYFQFNNLTSLLISFGEGSDYFFFLSNGVPAGGMHTGTDLPKPKLFRSVFGGIALAGFDPCYHDTCDTVANISPLVLEQNGKAAFYAATTISQIADLNSYLNDPSSLSPSYPHLLLPDEDHFFQFSY